MEGNKNNIFLNSQDHNLRVTVDWEVIWLIPYITISIIAKVIIRKLLHSKKCILDRFRIHIIIITLDILLSRPCFELQRLALMMVGWVAICGRQLCVVLWWLIARGIDDWLTWWRRQQMEGLRYLAVHSTRGFKWTASHTLIPGTEHQRRVQRRRCVVIYGNPQHPFCFYCHLQNGLTLITSWFRVISELVKRGIMFWKSRNNKFIDRVHRV